MGSTENACTEQSFDPTERALKVEEMGHWLKLAKQLALYCLESRKHRVGLCVTLHSSQTDRKQVITRLVELNHSIKSLYKNMLSIEARHVFAIGTSSLLRRSGAEQQHLFIPVALLILAHVSISLTSEIDTLGDLIETTTSDPRHGLAILDLCREGGRLFRWIRISNSFTPVRANIELSTQAFQRAMARPIK